MPEVFFTANWMLGEDRPGGPSGEEIIRRHNSLVAPDDQVWVVGNAVAEPGAGALAMLRRMNGHLYLVSGSRDATFAGNRAPSARSTPLSALEACGDYQRSGFRAVITGSAFAAHGNPVRVPLGHGVEPVDVWHFPRTGGGPGDEFRKWRPAIKRARQPWLVHGGPGDQVDVAAREISAAVDAWDFRPAHARQIVDLIEQS
jgi:calcineurin-like phosphoesterase family protein